MYVKIHKTESREIIAVCDKELVGKKFINGEMQLDISERFYKGEEKSEEEIIKILKNCSCANLVGEKSVRLGIKIGIISKDNVIKIKGIPHAQYLVI